MIDHVIIAPPEPLTFNATRPGTGSGPASALHWIPCLTRVGKQFGDDTHVWFLSDGPIPSSFYCKPCREIARAGWDDPRVEQVTMPAVVLVYANFEAALQECCDRFTRGDGVHEIECDHAPVPTKATLIAWARERKHREPVVLEEWNERAAIREYVGGLTRDRAERGAFADVIAYFPATKYTGGGHFVPDGEGYW